VLALYGVNLHLRLLIYYHQVTESAASD